MDCQKNTMNCLHNGIEKAPPDAATPEGTRAE